MTHDRPGPLHDVNADWRAGIRVLGAVVPPG
jgi:hypothetical protein